MGDESDKRPRVYVHSSTSEQDIEVTVKGSEGETTDDAEETAKRMYAMAKENVEEEVSETYE